MNIHVEEIIFLCALAAIAVFLVWCVKAPKLLLMHKLYLALVLCYASWVIPILILRIGNITDLHTQFVLESLTTPGGSAAPAIYLCIAIAFVNNLEKMNKRMWVMFIVPVITSLVDFTNPLHHLQYKVFSLIRSEIEFGPYVVVSGIYSYLCLILTIGILINFAVKNKSKLYNIQCLLMAVSAVVPMIISALATFSNLELSIAATPLSFMVPIVLNGIAIYQMHLLDIRPVATQHVLDWISDCYLVLSDSGLVISYNKQFASVFAAEYGIQENKYLKDCLKQEDISRKSAMYNMMTAIQSCKETNAQVSYEQAVTIRKGSTLRRCYYVTDVAPLLVHEKISGYVVIFKDITQLKESMQQLQDSKDRMVEQERLAFLGQMIGGLAHNLKTPIMGIAGSISALEALVDECEESIGDPEVVEEDYREIIGEARDWFRKVRGSASYMSDIITAIKGQATTAITGEDSLFTLDELARRCTLLMRHELQTGRCQLKFRYDNTKLVSIQGDINNLVQIVNNLLSNAIYAQKSNGGGEIKVDVKWDEEWLTLEVIDRGPGVSKKVQQKIFKSMVTDKGAKGTGLGLYISNAVVRGKFGGSMWVKDNPEGGAIFGVEIPMSRVTVTRTRQNKEGSF